MLKIFKLTVKALLSVGSSLKLTYNEINILVWYFIIPLLWVLIVSMKLHIPLLFVGATVIAVLIGWNFKKYSDSLFKKSVTFLLWFKHLGMNYIQASVVICLLAPLLITIALLLL